MELWYLLRDMILIICFLIATLLEDQWHDKYQLEGFYIFIDLLAAHVILLKPKKEWKFNLVKIQKDCLWHCGKFIFPPFIQRKNTWICWNCIETVKE